MFYMLLIHAGLVLIAPYDMPHVDRLHNTDPTFGKG